MTTSKQETTAKFFGELYVITFPNWSRYRDMKDIANNFYSPKSKSWYAFLKGMEYQSDKNKMKELADDR